MPLARDALSRLSTLARAAAARLRTPVGGLVLLFAFWICLVHLLPVVTSGSQLLRGPAPEQWSPQMRAIQTPLSRWDARWYFTIASHGYDYAGPNRESTIRFYPLYPMAMAATSWLTRASLMWAGTLVSAAALLGTLLLLARRTREESGDETAAATAECLLCFPSAFILATVYAEGLTLFAMVLAVTLARRQRWWGAGLAGAAAGMTRVNGWLVILPLLVLAANAWRAGRRWRPLGALGLVLLGACAFPIYLWWKFGDPLLYLHTRPPNWMQHPRFFLCFLWDVAKAAVTALAGGQIPRSVQGMPPFAFPVNVGVLVLMFWALVASVRKRRWDDSAFMAGACLFATSVGNLDSTARHGLICFPIFLRLGEAAAANRTVRQVLLLGFVALQTVLLLRYTHWNFVL